MKSIIAGHDWTDPVNQQQVLYSIHRLVFFVFVCIICIYQNITLWSPYAPPSHTRSQRWCLYIHYLQNWLFSYVAHLQVPRIYKWNYPQRYWYSWDCTMYGVVLDRETLFKCNLGYFFVLNQDICRYYWCLYSVRLTLAWRWMYGCKDSFMAGWMGGWVDGWMDMWADGWMYGWIDGWMDWVNRWIWVDGLMGSWVGGGAWLDGFRDNAGVEEWV